MTAPETQYLYHGTSSKALQGIERTGRVNRGYWGSREVAWYYAEVTAEEDGSEEEVVIAAPLSAFDTSKLEPDNPSLAEPLTLTLNKSEEEVWEEWEQSQGTWEDSLAVVQSVYYDAPVSLETIGGDEAIFSR